MEIRGLQKKFRTVISWIRSESVPSERQLMKNIAFEKKDADKSLTIHFSGPIYLSFPSHFPHENTAKNRTSKNSPSSNLYCVQSNAILQAKHVNVSK